MRMKKRMVVGPEEDPLHQRPHRSPRPVRRMVDHSNPVELATYRSRRYCPLHLDPDFPKGVVKGGQQR